MIRRVAVLCFLACSGFMTLGCSDSLIESPVEPQFAKPVKEDPAPAPTLEEFWVYSAWDEIARKEIDYVHMVVSGEADEIRKSVVFDHFFNGWWDDNPPVDLHYEFYFPGAPTPEAEPIGGMIHVDLPFRGERWVSDGVTYIFPNYDVTSVGGSGADPFTFSVAAYKNDQKKASWVPLGVIYKGETLDLDEVPSTLQGQGHEEEHSNVRSYATWKGDDPSGDIWVQSLDLDENVRCHIQTITEGRGKNKTTRTAAVVTGTIDVGFGRDPMIHVVPDHPEWEYVWWEGHFYDVTTGALSARAKPASQDGGMWSFSLEMPEKWDGGQVAFAIDYVYPSASPKDPFGNYAYNPALNGKRDQLPITIAGYLGEFWVDGTASTAVGDGRYPLALSPSFPVVCK